MSRNDKHAEPNALSSAPVWPGLLRLSSTSPPHTHPQASLRCLRAQSGGLLLPNGFCGKESSYSKSPGPCFWLLGFISDQLQGSQSVTGERENGLRLSASRNLYRSLSFMMEILAELAKAAVLERGGVHMSALKPLLGLHSLSTLLSWNFFRK